MNHLFPIFVKTEHFHVLIVGGGYVGYEKLSALLSNAPGTRVTIVAPEISKQVRDLAQKHHVSLLSERYQEKVLEGKDLVIAGTNDASVNEQVYNDCKARKIWINVADTPELCDFYLSSVVRKGDLKIAISTNGKSPTFAKRLRELLEEIIPDTVQEALDNLQQIRNKLKGDFQSKIDRLNEITKVMK